MPGCASLTWLLIGLALVLLVLVIIVLWAVTTARRAFDEQLHHRQRERQRERRRSRGRTRPPE
jgi:heme exporter protein D